MIIKSNNKYIETKENIIMIRFLEKIKEQGAQIVQEAKEEMGAFKVVHINSDNSESEDKRLTLEEAEVKSVKKKRKSIELAGTKGNVALPCSRCQINDLCKKAYSVNMPKYDVDMFELEVSCSRIIESLDMKEEKAQGIYLEEVNSNSQLPCFDCAIGDICSKANSLKIPAHDKELFTISVNCKRFINK